ncbi:MAG: hypothetical protein E7047_05355 [Lentisphaerae bacterium]|nr:hypothetical protein [Lentisphaerota bacterium]
MAEEEKKSYRPGFFCVLFWLICWIGMLGGIAALFFYPQIKIVIGCWVIAAIAAIISYFIRTMEKSSHDGHWSWHWFD